MSVTFDNGIRIAVSSSQKRKIRIAAAKKGVTMSAFARNAIIHAANLVHGDDSPFFLATDSHMNLKSHKRN